MSCRIWLRLGVVVCVALLSAAPRRVPAAPLPIVAAENFYGDVARQLAGPHARVVSVLSNPATDPHLFEPDPATARAVADATLIIYNGASYDAWMPRLLSGEPSATRQVIDVAALLHPKVPIANPHFWYDPATMPVLAHTLSARLQQLDPAHAAEYAQRLRDFLASLQPVDAQIERLHRRYAGTPITATEPVSNYLTAALGLVMLNLRYQFSIMNNTEPGARETAAFEQSLTSRSVRVLIYNRQATDSAVQRLLSIARQARVPMVAVSETEPPALDYQQWMLQVLDSLGQALATPRS